MGTDALIGHGPHFLIDWLFWLIWRPFWVGFSGVSLVAMAPSMGGNDDGGANGWRGVAMVTGPRKYPSQLGFRFGRHFVCSTWPGNSIVSPVATWNYIKFNRREGEMTRNYTTARWCRFQREKKRKREREKEGKNLNSMQWQLKPLSVEKNYKRKPSASLPPPSPSPSSSPSSSTSSSSSSSSHVSFFTEEERSGERGSVEIPPTAAPPSGRQLFIIFTICKISNI